MIPILVATNRKGIIGGLVSDDQDMNAENMAMTSARFLIRGKTTGGVGELAAVGPNPGSILGDASDMPSVRGIVLVLQITPEAWERWTKHVNA